MFKTVFRIIVYKVVFSDGKVYVGRALKDQTDGILDRLSHGDSAVAKAVRADRKKAVVAVLWRGDNFYRALAKEGFWVKYLKANDPAYGYNETRGGFYDPYDRGLKQAGGSRGFDYVGYVNRKYGREVIKFSTEKGAAAAEPPTARRGILRRSGEAVERAKAVGETKVKAKKQRRRNSDGSYSRVYDWTELLARGSFRLPATSSLRGQVRNAASRLGYSVSIRDEWLRGKVYLLVVAIKRSGRTSA